MFVHICEPSNVLTPNVLRMFSCFLSIAYCGALQPCSTMKRIRGVCVCVLACVRVRTCACWIWKIREEGHQIHRVAFLPGPLVLLGAATKTDRKEIEKSYNPNCHPEKASQTRPWSDRGRTLPFLLQLFSLQQSGLSSISMEITHPTPHHQHNGGFVIDLKRKRCIGRRKYIYNS